MGQTTLVSEELGVPRESLNRFLSQPENRHLKHQCNEAKSQHHGTAILPNGGVGKQVFHPYEVDYPVLAPSEANGYALDEVEDLLKYERSRNRKLTTLVRQLRGRLNDRETEAKELAEISASVLKHRADMGTQRGAGEIITKYIPRSYPKTKWYCLAPIADAHAGKYVWGREGWGGDYSTEETARRIEEQGRAAAEYISREGGECLGAIMPDVGDLFHALDGKTQSGTILHQDSRAKRVYEMTFEARLAAIEEVRKVTEYLEVYEAEGNHDYLWHSNFYHALEQHYRVADDVEVKRSNSKKVYLRLGECLHFFDHGKGINKLSTPTAQKKIRLTVEQRVPREELSNVSRVHFWCGHLHYREFTEDGLYYAERLPSLAEADEYEEEIRVASKAGAVMYRLDQDGFVEGTRNLYFSRA